MVVAPRLRLSQITALTVRFPEGLEIPTDSQCRVVIYSDAQEAPIFVSGPIATHRVVTIQDLDFYKLSLPIICSAEILIRVFYSNDSEWKLGIEERLALKNMTNSGKAMPISVQVDGKTYVHDPKSVPKKRTPSHHSLAAAALRQSIGRRALGPVETPNFDTLNKIMILQAAIDDAEDSIKSASAQINERVGNGYLVHSNKRQVLEAKLAKSREYIEKVKASTDNSRQEAQNLVQRSTFYSSELSASLQAIRSRISEPYDQPEDLGKKISIQQSRIATILADIFPIEPVEQSFHFTICGLPLPSVFTINHYDPIKVGAALGLVAQLVIMLSKYLDVPLPYPIRPLGSQSYITDPVSNIRGSRIFPLWTKGALLYRVEYALYLLHKDIEQLLSAKNLAVVDIKQTLANLKNLMLVMSN